MFLTFRGTREEFRKFKEKYPGLRLHVVYMGDGMQHNKEYAAVEERIKRDIEEMGYMRDKFIFVMDKTINKL